MPCRARRHAPGPDAGFTLVELLVASIILGIVVLMMTNGMRFIGRATAKAEARRDAVESTLTGLGLMRVTLGSTVPFFRKVQNKDQLVFQGEEQLLRLVTFEPDYMPGWPLVAYEYAVELQGGRYVLQVRRAALDPAQPDLDLLEEAEPRTLLAFADEPHFAFYGRLKGKDKEPAWHASWEGAELLPQAVRLGASGPEPGWPDFVLPLSINTPAACLNANAQESPGCGG
jgi:prepilin-type N-terminal cleavage/methylation domain-containing protein